MVDIKTVDAANAYANALKNSGGSSGGIGSIGSIGSLDGSSAERSSFSDILSSAIEGTSGAVEESSNISIQSMNNNAELVDVVTTVQNAEMVLETVVAVRDKVIAAYNDIIKMPM